MTCALTYRPHRHLQGCGPESHLQLHRNCPQAMQSAPQIQAHLSVLGSGVWAGLQLHKNCSEERGAGLLSLWVGCICRRPQHLPGDMGVELQIPDVRGRPMLRQRQRCSRKVALLRLLLGMPAAQSVLTMQPGTPLDLVRRVTR